MGCQSSRVVRCIPIVFGIALAVVCAAPVDAQAGSLTFLAPREAVLRHNGTPVRAGIKSMSQDEVVVVLKTGVEKSYSMTGITSIVAADNTFKYYPAQESFDEFLVKAASVRGVNIVRDDVPSAQAGAAGGGEPKTVTGVSSGYARMIGMQPPANPQITSTGGGFQQSGGFAGASQRPQGMARLETPVIPELDKAVVAAMEEERKAAAIDSVTPKFALPGVTSNGTRPEKASANEEVLICSNPKCGKEVRGAKYGDKCPYCGITWAAQTGSELLASSDGSTIVDPKNPFAKAGTANAPREGVAQPALAPAPPLPDVAAPAEGFNLETIPWWGKLLGFGASIMLLMFILGRR